MLELFSKIGRKSKMALVTAAVAIISEGLRVKYGIQLPPAETIVYFGAGLVGAHTVTDVVSLLTKAQTTKVGK